MGKIGKCSILFDKKPLIRAGASVVGQKESEGPLGAFFDEVIDDPMAGKNTWEEAESEFQSRVVGHLLRKAVLDKQDIRYIFAGDLLGQLIASSFVKIPTPFVLAAILVSVAKIFNIPLNSSLNSFHFC